MHSAGWKRFVKEEWAFILIISDKRRSQRMYAIWKFWLDVTSETKAVRVYTKLLARMQCSATLMHITRYTLPLQPWEVSKGYAVRCRMDVNCATQHEAIVETIELGQRIAPEWTLLGDIRHHPHGYTRQSQLPVEQACWWLFFEDAVNGGRDSLEIRKKGEAQP